MKQSIPGKKATIHQETIESDQHFQEMKKAAERALAKYGPEKLEESIRILTNQPDTIGVNAFREVLNSQNKDTNSIN